MANRDWSLWKAGRVLLWCSVMVCLFFGMGGGVVGAELEKITVYHKGRFDFGSPGVFMAMQKGYYAEEGLEVKLRYLRNDDEAILEQVKDQEGVYSKTNAWGLRHHMSGDDIVAFGSLYQARDVGLLVKGDSGIRSPMDLKGRRVMMPLDVNSMEIRAMLLKSGLHEDQFELIDEMGDMDRLFKGEADAVLSHYKMSTIRELGKRQASWSMLLPASYGIRFYVNVMVTSRVEADRHPDRVKAYYRATIRGHRYAWTHPEETISLYVKQATEDGLERVNMRNRLEIQAMTYLRGIDVDHLGKMSAARWREIHETFVALGEAEPVGTLELFLFDPDPQPNLSWVRGVVGGAVCVVMLSLVVVMWNRQLSQRVQQRTASLVESEARRALMMKELDHRVKNNLATVLSLSKQTLDRADSLGTFEEIFTGRLVTMAKSHEALAADAWTGIDLRSAVQLALEPYIEGAGQTVVVEGPAVKLPARAAIPVSMALHELSTNAAKYGALGDGQEDGRVELSWKVVEGEGVEILWRESGGPVIEGPIEPGVGMVLIKDLLEYDLMGRVEMAFEREGLCCKIRLPLEDGDQGLGDEGGEDSTLGAAPRAEGAPANSGEVNCLQG